LSFFGWRWRGRASVQLYQPDNNNTNTTRLVLCAVVVVAVIAAGLVLLDKKNVASIPTFTGRQQRPAAAQPATFLIACANGVDIRKWGKTNRKIVPFPDGWPT
jgi:hypothetical protein